MNLCQKTSGEINGIHTNNLPFCLFVFLDQLKGLDRFCDLFYFIMSYNILHKSKCNLWPKHIINHFKVSLGGLNDIHSQKNQKRLEAGLPLMTEDTHEVCKHMRASSPPASAADLIEQHQQIRRTFRGTKKVSRDSCSRFGHCGISLTITCHGFLFGHFNLCRCKEANAKI